MSSPSMTIPAGQKRAFDIYRAGTGLERGGVYKVISTIYNLQDILYVFHLFIYLGYFPIQNLLNT